MAAAPSAWEPLAATLTWLTRPEAGPLLLLFAVCVAGGVLGVLARRGAPAAAATRPPPRAHDP